MAKDEAEQEFQPQADDAWTSISRTNMSLGGVPVGSVIPYAGSNSPALEAQGWMLCDGRALRRRDFPELFQVIRTFHGHGDGVNTYNIPDYRGMFLRGVSGDTDRDPDRGIRSAAQPGGAEGNSVGSVQKSATARPNTPFETSENGRHTHTFRDQERLNHSKGENYWYLHGNYFDNNTGPAGEHRHSIERGGDAETRPINAYVNWIIRVKS
jgi:microcystin-dependent protein